MSITSNFVAQLYEWPAADPAITAMCRMLLLDGLAVAAAGASEPGPRLMAELAREQGGAPLATAIGQGLSTSLAQAARINGMAIHVLDYEPMWSPANHAISVILSPLLALAEKLEADGAGPQGERLFRALAKGIEAQSRLRQTSGQIEVRSLTLHPPGLVGAIAAALACGDLLGLDPHRLSMAVGIAASRSAGLLANAGTMTKALHCGDAAANGLEAALLAASGFTSNPDSLGDPRGYGAAYFGAGFDASFLEAPIVAPRIIAPGPAWKLFPSQYATHFAITAALDCHAELAAGAGIEAVRIVSPIMPYLDRPSPKTGLDGKFSLQYTVTAALLDGKVNVATFDDRRRHSGDMIGLLERVELVQSPEIIGVFDNMHVTVEVTTADGRLVRHTCNAPAGNWSRPIDAARIREKSTGLLRGLLSENALAALLDDVDAPIARLRVGALVAHLHTFSGDAVSAAAEKLSTSSPECP